MSESSTRQDTFLQVRRLDRHAHELVHRKAQMLDLQRGVGRRSAFWNLHRADDTQECVRLFQNYGKQKIVLCAFSCGRWAGGAAAAQGRQWQVRRSRKESVFGNVSATPRSAVSSFSSLFELTFTCKPWYTPGHVHMRAAYAFAWNLPSCLPQIQPRGCSFLLGLREYLNAQRHWTEETFPRPLLAAVSRFSSFPRRGLLLCLLVRHLHCNTSSHRTLDYSTQLS